MSYHRRFSRGLPHPNHYHFRIGYIMFMSVLSRTLTFLASLLIIGCASKGAHRHTLEDSHGFYPTPAYRVAQ